MLAGVVIPPGCYEHPPTTMHVPPQDQIHVLIVSKFKTRALLSNILFNDLSTGSALHDMVKMVVLRLMVVKDTYIC